MKKILTFVATTCFASAAFAGPPTVLKATAEQQGETWRFSVTLTHEDEGWDHYADGWGVYDADGNELGYRVLAHPHVNEMPFTRSLSGVQIPDGLAQVIIKPRDSVHGVGADFVLVLPK
ncbi:MAG: hypothetical protein AAF429_00070 [Pseudomonadota bacterium]